MGPRKEAGLKAVPTATFPRGGKARFYAPGPTRGAILSARLHLHSRGRHFTARPQGRPRRAPRRVHRPSAGAGPPPFPRGGGRSWAALEQAMAAAAAAGALPAAAARLGRAVAAAPEARLESVRALAGLFREAQPR